MRLGNLGGVPLEVRLIHSSTKEVDSIMLQPGGKPRLPDGYVIHPQDAARYHGVVRTLEDLPKTADLATPDNAVL